MAGLAVAIGCAIFAPLIAPYSEREVVGDIWLPMGGDLLLGTDNLGRDLLSRLVYGAQTTFQVALSATLLAFSLGIIHSFTAAVAGRWAGPGLSRRRRHGVGR